MVLAASCSVAAAQTPFNALSAASQGVSKSVGGSFTTDLVSLKGTSPGVPLRYGSIVPGSETVEFGVSKLVRGVDYQMDYEAGVVYLMRAQKPGQSLRVSYRYNTASQPTGVAGGSSFAGGLGAMQLSLVPNALNLVVGLGMAERTAGGQVLSTNVFGTRNTFNFGSGSLSGVVLLGDRQKMNASSDYEYRQASSDEGDTRSKFILQNLATSVAGGKIEAGVQDISSNFGAFQAVRGTGIGAAQVDQLAKERGLKRFSLSASNLNLGGMTVNQSFRNVRDGVSGIEWQKFGVQSGGFKADYTSQAVSPSFTRFADLAETDREQLQREVGLSRRGLNAEYKGAFGLVGFQGNEVEDSNGLGISRRSLNMDAGRYKFSLGDQRIDPGFTRFDSLFEQEKGQWAREAGLSRQWLSLEAAVFGPATPLKFATSSLGNGQSGFSSRDFSAGGKGWSLEHANRKVDDGFTQLGAMADSELDAHAGTVARMYSNDPYSPRYEDRMALAVNHGVERNFTKLALAPFKDWNVSFESLRLSGRQAGAGVDTAKVSGKGFAFQFRDQKIGTQFSELAGLMELERARLGPLVGMRKTDWSFAADFSPTKKLNVQATDVGTDAGGASRRAVSYVDKGIEVKIAEREVDPGFTMVGAMVDPERDFLTTIVGYKQREIHAKWQVLPSLSFETLQYDAISGSLNQEKYSRTTSLTWKPDPRTQLAYTHSEQKNDDPMSVLTANVTDRLSLFRDLGRFGVVEYVHESQDFDGTLNTMADLDKHYLAYSTKLNDKTALRAEQSRTVFDNGDKEDVSANTISTELSKRAGVSVTDVQVDRNGSDRDEKRRNYGFWFDFGNGMRLNYGYARQLLGPSGTLQSLVSLTGGNVGGVTVGGGSYSENRIDNVNTQGVANLQLSSTKPFRLGFLKDVQFNFGLDTATDQTNFIRENRQIKVESKLGSNTLGYEYKSQLHPSGFSAIDRAFRFTTDQSESRWLRASLDYKLREMPDQGLTVIRNFQITARPTRGMELSHQVLTNPEEQFRSDVLLGSLTSPLRVNRWKLDYAPNTKWSLAAVWAEKLNDLTFESSRLGGVTLELFKDSGSPLSLFYGVEQLFGNVPRRTAHRYSIRFDQRPGPNQLLSLFAGNVSYEHSIADGFSRNNWTVNVNYQLKF